MTAELQYLSVAELARLFRRRQLSPVELTRSLLDRIARFDGRIHAFLTVTEPLALAQAKAAELEIGAGLDRGLIHGIPFGLKDIIATAGIRTTAHSKLLEDDVPNADATLVHLIYCAGGILLGKLATFEFALDGPSFDLPWPPARNPWNLDHLPGGSSSGPAAAVAAGFVPMAIGTDTGGSIRSSAAPAASAPWPASWITRSRARTFGSAAASTSRGTGRNTTPTSPADGVTNPHRLVQFLC